jgi:hypothetical protein
MRRFASTTLALALVLAACTGGVPASTELETAGPDFETTTPSAPPAATQAMQTARPTVTPTQEAATTPPVDEPTPGGLTADEMMVLTGDTMIPMPPDAPEPLIDAAAAEAEVRLHFPGERTTLAVVRIATRRMGETTTGWFVALTPATDGTCSLNPGLLSRPIEGGIVSDQAGGIFWTFACPESDP